MTITAPAWTAWDSLTEHDQAGNLYPSRDFAAHVRRVLEDNPTPDELAAWAADTIVTGLEATPADGEHDTDCWCTCDCCEAGQTRRPRPRANPEDPATVRALEALHALEHRYSIALTADPAEDDGHHVDAGTFAAALALARQFRHTSAGDLPRQLRALTHTVAQLQDAAADLATLAAIARNPTREDTSHD